MLNTSKLPPTISIIIPIYNIEKYISDALNSILTQTYQNFEVIVIDDGSTDNSLEIAKKICKNNKNVHILTQKNKGLSATRNKGIEISTGEYIYFFDGDDLLASNTLETCLDLAHQNQLDLIVFSGEAFSEKNTNIDTFQHYKKPSFLVPQSGERLFIELENTSAYSSSACLYICSRKLINTFNLRFDEGFLHEDESFTAELYCYAKRAISLEEPFFQRRVRPKSIMTTPRTFKNIEGYIQVVNRINNNLIQTSSLKPETKSIFRSKQRALLRSARKSAEQLNLQKKFSTLLLDSLSIKEIFAIDPMMLLYLRANKAYKLLQNIANGSQKLITIGNK